MLNNVLEKIRSYVDQRTAVDNEYNTAVAEARKAIYADNESLIDRINELRKEVEAKEDEAFTEFVTVFDDINNVRNSVYDVTVKPMSEDVQRTIEAYSIMRAIKGNLPALERLCGNSFLAFKYLDYFGLKLGNVHISNEVYRSYNTIINGLNEIESFLKKHFVKYERRYVNSSVIPYDYNSISANEIHFMYNGDWINDLSELINDFIAYFG